jgi:sugar lactone lactonase YvrE
MTAPERWRAHRAGDEIYTLGEGPVWDGPRDRVLWVDIEAGTVHEGRLDGDRIVPSASHQVDRTVGAVAVSARGDIVVAAAQDIKVLTADGQLLGGPRVLPVGARRRLNDGACDPAGRFLVGSLELVEPDGGEILARVEPDGAITVLDRDLNLSNGLAWSADGAVFYSIDSVPGIVYTRDYDAATATGTTNTTPSDAVGPRRELLRTGGLPDGMCVDAEGCLWIAIWGTGEVRRYASDGVLIGVVETDALHVTCPAFVGPDLDRLLITTATQGLSPDQLSRSSDSGRLLLADVGVVGLPTAAWSGEPWPAES